MPLAELPQSTVDDVARAGETASRAQRDWVRVPVRERAKILLRYHDVLWERQDEIIELIQVETGKSRWHAFQQIASNTMNMRYYGLRAERLQLSNNLPIQGIHGVS